MITKEEYLKAKAIVHQYERDEYEEKQRDADDAVNEFDDCGDGEEDEDDILERREMERAEIALNCSCGAWVIGSDGRGHHVADCICGAE